MVGPSATDKALGDAVETQLNQAELIVNSRGPRLSLITGANIQAAREYIDAAAINLLRLMPPDYLASLLPSILIEARRHLNANDPRLQTLAKLEERLRERESQEERNAIFQVERPAIVAVAQAGQAAAHQEQTRVRGFRNVILGVTAVVFFTAALLAIVGFWLPTTFPLCFAPEEAGSAVIVCPLGQSPPFPTFTSETTPWQTSRDIDDAIEEAVTPLDIAAVEFLGVLGATIAAASSLRNIRANPDPYSLGVALAFLKLPTGALTAFLGLTLIRSGVIPGLTALDTSAQIVAWAITLGYSQQLFTRFVDQQGQQVLQQADGVTPTGRNN
jgi:hypothetical protein